jgi:predicted transposase/invertase (TIGR01784 family)
MQLLDPKNDYIFKRLFASAPELLTELINAVRYDEEPVEVVEVLNPRIDPADLAGKFIVLDVLARDRHGQLFNIEMQVRRFDGWSQRGTYYLANTLAKQLDSGDNYLELKPVIGIHLLDFDLFTAPEQLQQAHWCFEMRDRWQPATRLGAELQLNIIELAKADRLQASTQAPNLAAWVAFFEHWKEESTMSQLAYPPVQQALNKLKDLSADSETQQRASVRERALRDEVTQVYAAEQRGKLEGLQEGKLEGKLEGLQEGKLEGLQEGLQRALAKMIQSGMNEAQARAILGL